ncbi:MAG: hypothetical protein OSJ58_16630 [Dysosmobacter sp.]|nr:hypothetical protein [Dysosmobacter sp.]
MNKTKENDQNPLPWGRHRREGEALDEQQAQIQTVSKGQKPPVVGAKSTPRGTPFGHSALCFLAPPLPIEPASLGFDGGPKQLKTRNPVFRVVKPFVALPRAGWHPYTPPST